MLDKPYRDWQAPPERRRSLIATLAGYALMATVGGFALWVVTIPWRKAPNDRTTAAEAVKAAADAKAPFVDPIKGPGLIEDRVRALFNVSYGFLRIGSWGGDAAVVLVPLSTPWSVICDGGGLRISVNGVANPHAYAWNADGTGQIDMGPDDGLMIAEARFTTKECDALAAVAAKTLTAIMASSAH
jgi:hypothetical protein